MKQLFYLILKHLRTNKKRTIATIIGIILSTSLLFGVGLFFSTYRDNLIKEVTAQIGPHHIEYKNVDYSKLNIINSNLDVGNILTKVKYITNGKITNDQYHTNIEIWGLDTDYHNILNIIEGTIPKNNNEVIISEYLARKHDFKVNDNIIINNITYQIVGIYQVKTLSSSYYYSLYEQEIVYSSFEANENSLVDIYVTLESPKHAIAKLTNLTENLGLQLPKLEKNINSNQQVSVNTKLLALYGEFTDAGIYAVLYFSAILILTILSIVCILIISNSFAISISERKKQFGILASIGTTPKQILYSIYVEAGILSLIAIPTGIILSVLSVSFILTILNKILEDIIINQLTLSIYPYYILLSLTFILMTIFLSTLFPAIHASEISPLDAIKLSKDIQSKKQLFKANDLITNLFGIEGSLAYKNMKRQKSKYRITLISLVASIVLFVTTFTYINRGLKSIKSIYDRYPYDVIITVSEGEKRKEFIDQIKSIKEITDILEYKSQRFFIEKHDQSHFTQGYLDFQRNPYDVGPKSIVIHLLSDESYQKYLKRIGLKTDQPIFINYGVYIRLDKDGEIEDKYEGPSYKESPNLKFKLCNFEDYPKNEKIKECYYELTNLYFTNITPFNNYQFYSTFIVNQQTYNDIMTKIGKTNNENTNSINLQIKIKNAKKFDEEVRKIFEKTPNLTFSYQNPKLESYKIKTTQLAAMFALYSFAAFVTLIAITSVMNTINTSINLRKTEFAILKSIGQSPESFNKMIMYENIFLGIKALFYGLLASFGVINIIMRITDLSYGEHKIKLPFPTLAIIICIIAIFFISLIITKYSINKLKKENIIETIKNENI